MTADHKGGAGKDLTDISYICGNTSFSGGRKIRDLINWRSSVRKVSKRNKILSVDFSSGVETGAYFSENISGQGGPVQGLEKIL